MSLATLSERGRRRGPKPVSPLRQVLRPAVGFDHPADVLKDPFLDSAEKRAILSSWACDANAVESEPTLRRLPGSDHAVRLMDVLAALRRLDS